MSDIENMFEITKLSCLPKMRTFRFASLDYTFQMKLLNNKMKQFASGAAEWSAFNRDDVRKLYGKLTTAVGGADEDVQTVMNAIDKSGKGTQAKKLSLLRAWVRTPDFGENFFEEVSTFVEEITFQ